jgi:benzoyl-CoA 2,3-dioxygenase component B
MLTEEAHHMFVGETGVGRAIELTCQAMKEAGVEDAYDINAVRKLGVIDLPTMQKKANLHFSLSLDLFGSEVSTNAANYYSSGLKGRYRETGLEDDHVLTAATYPVSKLVDGKVKVVDESALTAINMRLRDDYVDDCSRGMERWNRAIEKAGIAFRFKLPHVAFHRHIGEFQSISATPEGEVLSDGEWASRKEQWLPSKADGDFIESLMQPCWEPGKFASWIAPPKVGIDNKAGDFEYVKIHRA